MLSSKKYMILRLLYRAASCREQLPNHPSHDHSHSALTPPFPQGFSPREALFHIDHIYSITSYKK